jgi:hypothetical protein
VGSKNGYKVAEGHNEGNTKRLQSGIAIFRIATKWPFLLVIHGAVTCQAHILDGR